MTVSVTAPVIKYPYTGAGDYDFLFLVYAEEDLALVHTDTSGVVTELVLSTDYTVTLATSPSIGGTCHLTYAPTDGYLDIRRTLALEQQIDWVNNNALDMEILEKAFDRDVMMIQQIQSYVESGVAVAAWRDAWVTATDYKIFDWVIGSDTNIYICNIAHTSAALFATDLAAGYWKIAVDIVGILADAGVESAAAAVSAAAALVSETNAAASETNVEASEFVCLSASNFKGLYISQTGSATPSYSVYYNGVLWGLLYYIADVTAHVPGVSAAWQRLPMATETNPNLLINPNFIVNQEGYAGGTLVSGEYIYDMWEAHYNDGSVTVSGVDVTINGGATTWGVVKQKNDDLVSADGETITISVETGSVYVSDFVSALTLVTPSAPLTYTYSTTDATNGFVGIAAPPGDSVTFSGLKVERGMYPTQYNVPQLTDEQLKCARYYRKIEGPATGSMPLGFGYATSATTAYFSIATEVEMRSTVAASCAGFVVGNGGGTGSSSLAVTHVAANLVVVEATVASGLIANDIYTYSTTTYPLILDARY